ncbi:MAG: SWIB/MDM2 domain-containing protein [Gemmatimonadaceae bacterium]
MATRKKAAKKRSAKKSSSRKKGRKTTAKKRTAKRPAKRKAAKKKKTRTKRTPNAAFMKPMQPDAALSEVVGPGAMPRTQVTKKIWAYIKRKDLQDPKERRMIIADDKLRPIFGGKSRVSMFEMTKLVNRHLKDS